MKDILNELEERRQTARLGGGDLRHALELRRIENDTPHQLVREREAVRPVMECHQLTKSFRRFLGYTPGAYRRLVRS